MPEYLSPGVYVEEISAGPVPIEGVSTSTTGFVGQTARGPTAPTLVTSFTDYQRTFGGLLDPSISMLPFASKGFFDNGGQRLFVARVVGAGALPATLDLGGNVVVEAIGSGAWGQQIFVQVRPSTLQSGAPLAPVGFRITVLYYNLMPPVPLVDPFDPAQLQNANRREPSAVEDYDNLRIDPNSSEYVLSVINGSSQLIHIATPAAAIATPAAAAYAPLTLAAGGGGAAVGPNDYIGDDTLPTNQQTGLAGLAVIDEISILACPDEALAAAGPNVTSAMITQCIRIKNRFAVTAVPNGQGNVAVIHPPMDTSWAAIYYPWIRVFNPTTNDNPLISPVGHICGIYANTDIERGVHKAPANYEVLGMLTQDIDATTKALEFIVTKGQQDILNPIGVNVIRDFRSHGRGIRVWGARTMSTDGQWKYINVRRLFIFVEQSIDRGTQWVVFEPNDETTWARVRRSIENFLITVWRSGALMGTKQDEAFFVKCDLTTMTQDDIDNGRLICYIGIAPVKPAEFVIFRISQKTLEAQS
jgi:phage tail sheath protein FI